MNPIVKTLLPIVKLLAPTLSPVIDDVENAVSAGSLSLDNATQLAEHLLVVGETYFPKDTQILADIANLIPVLAKLVTDIQNQHK